MSHDDHSHGHDAHGHDSHGAPHDGGHGGHGEDARLQAAEGCSPPQRDKANMSTRVSTSGSFVTVLYVRTCARGTIAEQFLMRLGGDGPEVEGYHISGEPILASPRV